jgi:prepilin-type N-terminal cleavage/methylation domain-containing protein
MRGERAESAEAGFSLIEVIVAMALILFVMTAAFTLLAGAFGVRTREDDRTEALSTARRAMHVMTREIASSGFNLPTGTTIPPNGIVAAQSGITSIRILSNHGGPNAAQAVDEGEDILYRFATDPATGRQIILRHDYNDAGPQQTSLVVDNVTNLRIRYFDRRVDYTAANCNINVTTAGVTDSADITRAKYVVMTICVNLPEIGTPGDPSYKPESRVQLTSDVTLRNSGLSNF